MPCFFPEYKDGIKHAIDALNYAPTVEAEPARHGWWIPTEYDSYADGVPVWDKLECSECGHEHRGEEDTLTAFCPACGARMDADETEMQRAASDDYAEF